MIMAATKALAHLSPAREDKDAALLPPIADSRAVSMNVAESVAKQAIEDGVAGGSDAETIYARLRAYVWEPVYLPYQRLL